MTTSHRGRLGLDTPVTYRIQVQGRLDQSWSRYFDGLAITSARAGHGPTVTTLQGTVRDQAALHGILTRIRDLGLVLLLVQVAGAGEG